MIGFLYGQTQYSCLENTVKLERYLSFMKDSGFKFASMTDNNLVGSYKFYKACKSMNLKPVIGLKTLIGSDAKRENYILLYAKNKIGFKNLSAISTNMELEKIVSDEFIKEHSEGLILVSSAVDSDLEYYQMIMNQEAFDAELARLKGLTDTFYYGIMADTMNYDTLVDEYQDVIKKYHLEYLPLNKGLYFKGEEFAFKQMMLLASREVPTANFALKNQSELESSFAEIEGAFDCIEGFYEMIEDYQFRQENHLKKYSNDLKFNAGLSLEKMATEGLRKRLVENKIADRFEEYKTRLDYELSIIEKMGYSDYFLIVQDYVNYAKEHDIYVGPGRGSSCGSLVAYCLNIIDVDPIKFDLYFERFLNPQRVTMPDIDIDFEDIKREEVIKYVSEKYGREHVCYIGAVQTFSFKSAIYELFRVNNVSQQYLNIVRKMLETKTFDQIIANFDSHPEIVEIIKTANIIDGIPKSHSTHASGILISEDDLTLNIPLKKGTDQMYQTQFDHFDLEELGFLKFDFLGLNNLTLIKQMLKIIKLGNANFDLKKISLNDNKTFEMLKGGDTLGIFQLEGAGFTEALIEMEVENFNNLIALNALYRPAAKEMIPIFAERKKSHHITYLAKELEPILKQTYGVIVYQEQVMKIFEVFAGYSLGEADLIRRAIANKDSSAIASKRADFIARGSEKGFNKNLLEELYSQIEQFAGYGFNKGHSTAYALIAYQMAYIKANYPIIFIAVMMHNNMSNNSGLSSYYDYAVNKGIKVLGPNINTSTAQIKIVDDALLLPLTKVRGVSTKEALSIVKNRRSGYSSFLDFVKRNELPKEMVEDLIYASCFDDLETNKKALIQFANNVTFKYSSEDELVYTTDEYELNYLREKELESLGINIKYNPFSKYRELKKEYRASDVGELVSNKKANVIGLIIGVKETTTRNDKIMAFVTISVNGTNLDLTVFPDLYQLSSSFLKNGNLVLANGIMTIFNGRKKFTVDRIKTLQ